MKADRDRCLAAGMIDFIPKPVRRQQLRTVLSRVVGAAAAVEGAPVPQADPSATILDEQVLEGLRELAELDEEFSIASCIRLFLDETPACLARAREAMASGDTESLHREVHTIKGAGREVGATDLASRSEALEKAIKNEEPVDLPSGLDELQQSLVQVSQILGEMAEREEETDRAAG